jgi:hypothetical protein
MNLRNLLAFLSLSILLFPFLSCGTGHDDNEKYFLIFR